MGKFYYVLIELYELCMTYFNRLSVMGVALVGVMAHVTARTLTSARTVNSAPALMSAWISTASRTEHVQTVS